MISDCNPALFIFPSDIRRISTCEISEYRAVMERGNNALQVIESLSSLIECSEIHAQNKSKMAMQMASAGHCVAFLVSIKLIDAHMLKPPQITPNTT